MKVSTFSGHVSVDDSGRTVMIGSGEQFPDDAEVVLARPEFFSDLTGPESPEEPVADAERGVDTADTPDAPEGPSGQATGVAEVKPARRRTKA